MICKECKSCFKGWYKDKPDTYVCIGRPEPTIINDVGAKCLEYGDDWHASIAGCVMPTHTAPDRPRFIMLVGPPGCGKSTYASYAQAQNTIVVSSDSIRGELFGDESCQDDNNKVFEIMHGRTLEALRHGTSVIYDATNMTRKSRYAILSKIPDYVVKECVICWAHIDVCIARDCLRDRRVGEYVIDKMVKRFEAPFYDEGFDSILVWISDIHYNKEQYLTDLIAAIDIPHDNPHHTYSVLNHCTACGRALVGQGLPKVLVNAGFLHDIGKAYTKTFTNMKGEITDTAHYYGHQAVGAWLSYGIEGHNVTLAWLISTHMAPFINQKYYNSLPPYYKNWIEKLHQADCAAH